MKILIDNGHGAETPGKRSPDGRLREWEYARRVARRVARALELRGVEAHLLVEEEADVPLKERVGRVREHCQRAGGAAGVLLVSIHLNAAGSGAQWMGGRGWEVLVSPNASRRSKRLATCLAQAAKGGGLRLRTSVPGQDYKVQNLAICRDTPCAACLTENLFMDNREEATFLLSKAGEEAVVRLHVEGILNFLNT